MNKYIVRYDYLGLPCQKIYTAESAGEAVEMFELWAEGLAEYAELLSVAEYKA